MESTLIILGITILLYIIMYVLTFKRFQKFRTIYFNLFLLMIVSLYIGYSISRLSANSYWYSYVLILIFMIGIINLLYKTKLLLKNNS